MRKEKRIILRFPLVPAVALSFTIFLPAVSADYPSGVPKDAGKGKIESPLKSTIAGPRPPRGFQSGVNPAPRHDNGKGGIQNPLKKQLRAAVPPPDFHVAVPKPATTFVNPKVEPGKVRWHDDFKAAVAAAKKSRKPVLLFQMIGRMDERFS